MQDPIKLNFEERIIKKTKKSKNDKNKILAILNFEPI